MGKFDFLHRLSRNRCSQKRWSTSLCYRLSHIPCSICFFLSKHLLINAYINNYHQHITINKCLIGFQRRKLLIVIACSDYNIVFKILLGYKNSFQHCEKKEPNNRELTFFDSINLIEGCRTLTLPGPGD